MTDFKRMRGPKDLAKYLGCGQGPIDRILNESDDQLFTKHAIPKKGPTGGTREIWAIEDAAIAGVYKAAARRLQKFFYDVIHPAAHGYVQGRSTRTNAIAHLGAKRILKADIQGFFRSVPKEKVAACLQNAGLTPTAACALCEILVRENHLPLGLHTSPILANAVCYDLDERLTGLIPGGTYTRYADDLAFSGPELPSKNQIEEALSRDGFQLAQRKYRVARWGRRLYLTGLSLEDLQTPRVPKTLKHRIRQELYFAKKWGLAHHTGVRNYPSIQSAVNQIDGTIKYIRGIEPVLGNVFETKWQDILKSSGRQVSFPALRHAKQRNIHFFVDESVIDGPNGCVMALALVVVEDIDHVRKRLEGFLEDLIADPDSATSEADLEKDGLHWNTLAQDDRTSVTKTLRELPLRAFVAFKNLHPSDYSATYIELLQTLLQGRMIKFDRCTIHISVEQNSNISKSQIDKAVQNEYDKLKRLASRRPTAPPHTDIMAKRCDSALDLPDLLLGIFGDYARVNVITRAQAGIKKKKSPGANAQKRFARVQDKFRAIFDVENHNVFSRKQAFQPWEH